MQDKRNIVTISVEEVDRPFRVKQLFNAIFKQGVIDFALISTLPLSFRSYLKEHFCILELEERARETSVDGTVKFLFQLKDGNCVEAVFLMDKNHHVTFCISSQVGCRMGCVFCQTGKMGLIRNLTSYEILSEVIFLYHFMVSERQLTDRMFNIVYMGMGEPFDNYDALIASLELITDPRLFALSPTRITVSTSGLIDKIEPILEKFPTLKIALSLNSPIQKKREEIMPVAKKYCLEEIAVLLKRLYRKTRNRFTLEYVLIKNENMGKEECKALELFRHEAFHINVIPLNHSDERIKRPEEQEIQEFVSFLERKGFCVTRRYRRGADINADCGQLYYSHSKIL